MASVHHLRIALKGIRPSIWREVFVPSDIRLDRLHQVIQIAMGWEDCHLHEFSSGARGLVGELRFGPSPPRAGFAADIGPRVRDEKKAALGDLAPTQGSKFRYWYDFGDDWFHDISVKAIGEAKPGTPVPLCIKAAGACPPEDCGGPYGYMHMLDVLADPGHEEYAALRQWIGREFDPAGYDIAAVNEQLAKVAMHWSRPARAGRGGSRGR